MSSGDFSIGGNVWPGTSKLIEEMGETAQVLGKLIGSHGETAHYDGSDLRQRLVEELGDLQAAIVFFQDQNLTLVEQTAVAIRMRAKVKKFEQWQKEGK